MSFIFLLIFFFRTGLFGVHEYFLGVKRENTAKAIVDVDVLSLDHDAFTALSNEHPAFANVLLQGFLRSTALLLTSTYDTLLGEDY